MVLPILIITAQNEVENLNLMLCEYDLDGIKSVPLQNLFEALKLKANLLLDFWFKIFKKRVVT